MNITINFQTKDNVSSYQLHPYNKERLNKWIHENLGRRGHKFYLILTGENPLTKTQKEFCLTSSIIDVEEYIHNVCVCSKIFIQEFEYGDYEAVLCYLSTMYDINSR